MFKKPPKPFEVKGNTLQFNLHVNGLSLARYQKTIMTFLEPDTITALRFREALENPREQNQFLIILAGLLKNNKHIKQVYLPGLDSRVLALHQKRKSTFKVIDPSQQTPLENRFRRMQRHSQSSRDPQPTFFKPKKPVAKANNKTTRQRRLRRLKLNHL